MNIFNKRGSLNIPRRGLLGEICDKLGIEGRMQILGKKSRFGIKFGIYGGAIGANFHEFSFREDSHL